MYEVIAEPQEQTEQAQEERRENPAQGPSDSSSEQQPEVLCLIVSIEVE